MIAFHTRKWRPKRLFFAPQPLHSAALCWKLRSSALSCAAQIQMLYLLAVGSYDFKTSDLPRQAWERDTMPPGKTAAAAQCQLNKVVTSGAKTRHSSAASAALKRSTVTNYSPFHHPLHYIRHDDLPRQARDRHKKTRSKNGRKRKIGNFMSFLSSP